MKLKNARSNEQPDSTLVEYERSKYEKIWAFEQYRNSVCNLEAETFIDAMGMPTGSTIIDFGCGGGAASRLFQERGMRVTGIDLAENCLDKENIGYFPFMIGCLWDLPRGLSAEYGFCTDVMEHIPTEKVEATLANIRRCITGKVYFNISLRKDHSGALIGDTLHLTVMPVEWWESELRRHWQNVDIISVSPGSAMTVHVGTEPPKPALKGFFSRALKLIKQL